MLIDCLVCGPTVRAKKSDNPLLEQGLFCSEFCIKEYDALSDEHEEAMGQPEINNTLIKLHADLLRDWNDAYDRYIRVGQSLSDAMKVLREMRLLQDQAGIK